MSEFSGELPKTGGILSRVKENVVNTIDKYKKLNSLSAEYYFCQLSNKDNKAAQLLQKNQKFIESTIFSDPKYSSTDFKDARNRFFSTFFNLMGKEGRGDFSNSKSYVDSHFLKNVKAEFLYKNFDNFFRSADSEEEYKFSFLMLKELTNSSNKEHRDKAIGFISQKYGKWFKGLGTSGDPNEVLGLYTEFFLNFYKRDEKLYDPRPDLLSFFESISKVDFTDELKRDEIHRFLTPFIKHESVRDYIGKEYLNKFIKDNDLRSEFINSLREHPVDSPFDFSSKFSPDIFIEAIINMNNLEARMSGSVEFLIKNFGIMNFSRYPVETLLEQIKDFKESDGLTEPYGVMVFSRTDWNGAFSNREDNEKIVDEISKEGYKVRIIEARDRLDLLLKIMRIHKIFGGKFQFLIVSAHGSKDGFSLNSRSKNGGIGISDLTEESNASKYLKQEVYDVNMPLVLRSCSTGKEGGFAQKFSEFFSSNDGQVVAVGPEIDTNLQKLKVTKKDGQLYFEVYYDPDDSKDKNPAKYYGRNE